MRGPKACAPLITFALLPGAAIAHEAGFEAPGNLISVSVEVDGRPSPLYLSAHGSGRYYLEAREGSRYQVRVENHSHERLGVVLTVDGLNAISGEREGFSAGRRFSGPGRMYILDPWDSTVVRGWRTSLKDVHRFTFVDERASYAARTGKVNARMGWIEVAVYRERRPYVRRYGPWLNETDETRRRGHEPDIPAPSPPAAAGEAEASADRDAKARPEPRASEDREGPRSPQAEARSRREDYGRPHEDSYPGTGWGPRAEDRAVLVHFDPEPSPVETITLRYEYARALRALGILPSPWWDADRLRERERGASGFARPPGR